VACYDVVGVVALSFTLILPARLDDPALAVRVDPADQPSIVIAWDEPVPGGAT
jgi:hypothetical protein